MKDKGYAFCFGGGRRRGGAGRGGAGRGGAGRVGQIRCRMGNVEVAYFQNKLRHTRRQNLAWEPANLRGSRLEFQRLSDLLNFQVLNISIYNARTVEEWANVI